MNISEKSVYTPRFLVFSDTIFTISKRQTRVFEEYIFHVLAFIANCDYHSSVTTEKFDYRTVTDTHVRQSDPYKSLS